jgi:hypothetical protein
MATTSITELSQVERRAAERRAITLPVTIHLAHASVALATMSASERGVFITSEHAPPVGFGLHVTIALPDGPLEAIATVVRVVPGEGLGARLTVPGEEPRARWRAFLAAHASAAHMPRWHDRDPRELFDFTWSNEGAPDPM